MKKEIIYCKFLFFPLFFLLPFFADASVIQKSSTNLGSDTLRNGLIGHWTFDGKDITDKVYDRSGQGNHGGFYGGATSSAKVAGKIGQGLRFDGVNDRVGLESIYINSQLSISVWFKIIGEGPQYYQGIVSKTTGDGAEDNYRIMSLYSDTLRYGVAACTVTCAGMIDVTVNNRDGKWHHAVLTFDGTTIKAYYDGVYKDSLTRPGTINNNNAKTNIGSFLDDYGNLNGYVDEVRMYNRALSNAEVAQLYRLGQNKYNVSVKNSQSLLESGLVGWWTFDGKDTPWTSSTAGTVIDKSGNGNTGTLTNMNRSITPTIGKLGQGLKFDGSNDYVNLGTDASLTPSDITVSAWVKANQLSSWSGILSNMTTWGTGFGLQIGTTQNIAAMISGAYLKTSWTPVIGKWYHIVATHNNSNDYNALYINGVYENSVTRAVSYEGSAKTYIGVFYTSPSLIFNGTIDDVRIYNRVLSSDEVSELYKFGQGKIISP